MQLGNNHPLGPVDDEGAVVRHQRHLAHVDFLLLHVLHGLVARGLVLLVNHQAQQNAQRGGVDQAALLALLHVERRRAQPVADELQRRTAIVALDGKHRVECGLQTLVRALLRRWLRLQELAVRFFLGGQQVGHAQNARPLAEALAKPLLFSEGIAHGYLSDSRCFSYNACPGNRRHTSDERPTTIRRQPFVEIHFLHPHQGREDFLT